ncbi:hypothetical protein PGT21_018675 [Puccinia graminis f. sp. tritici]|uniref:Uncharacterized protein n=1 Tax=Puccinia graminis f. sp. tritici TaxID=56615 RepID=A0A5B0QN31_PUCGR|nr:hypothetical protein PGT21_018675 [Puccinia graminis f. sp. tritici]
MDAYATTILDTQESVLQQNIHPQEDPFRQAGTSCVLAEVYPPPPSYEYGVQTCLARPGRHVLAEQAQAIAIPARSDSSKYQLDAIEWPPMPLPKLRRCPR